MRRFLRDHEAFVLARLREPAGVDLDLLAEWHEKHIARFQHERLIHLLVLLACCVLAFLSFMLTVATTADAPRVALTLLLLALVTGYIHHYFVLENGVQRWYHIANEIDVRRGRVATRYRSVDGLPAPPTATRE